MAVQVIKATKEKKRLRVAAYCRVSTEAEIQENSIENQKEHYEEQIKSNPDYEFAGIYYDFGVSGYKENRPGFQAMMKDAREGKMDLIITKSITRFARNTKVMLKSIRELSSLGIGVFFELQNMNTLTEAGELLLTVYSAFAQGESETYRGLAQMAYKRKCEEGRPEYQYYKSLGYEKDKETGEIVINETEAEWIRQIYKWVIQNYSTETIVKMALEKGMKVKSGKPFSGQWVYKLVRNVLYKGDYIMQYTYTDENRKVHVGQTMVPSYYIEDDHPAIVSKATWAKANKVLDDRAAERLVHIEIKPWTEENYPYKKKIFCAKCGGRLRAQATKSGAQLSFSCGRRNRNGVGFCTGVSVPQKILETWLPIEDNIYVSFDPDKPLHKQHSYVKESTWLKKNSKKQLPDLPEYNTENYHYCRRVFCDKCGHHLTRSRRYDGHVEFICNGMGNIGRSYCTGIRVPQDVLERLPKQEGYFMIKEEIKDGKKSYSYTCKKEKPQCKQQHSGDSEN